MLKNVFSSKFFNYYYVCNSLRTSKKKLYFKHQIINPQPQLPQFLPREPYEKRPNPAVSMSASQKRTNYFGNSFLDRQSDRRKDTKWLDEQMRAPNTVFILFHVDRPFMNASDQADAFALSKFTYDQVKTFINDDTKKCNWLFLGVEYERRNDVNDAIDEKAVWSIRSPYSNLDDYYNLDKYKSWFAIDTSGYSDDVEKVTSVLGNGVGKFFDGNFLRLMAVSDVYESSVIAQVSLFLEES